LLVLEYALYAAIAFCLHSIWKGISKAGELELILKVSKEGIEGKNAYGLSLVPRSEVVSNWIYPSLTNPMHFLAVTARDLRSPVLRKSSLGFFEGAGSSLELFLNNFTVPELRQSFLISGNFIRENSGLTTEEFRKKIIGFAQVNGRWNSPTN
jgi:hypothetical protein